MNQPLFRQKSLDAVQSPDQLDRMLTVTPARSWIALLGLLLLFAGVLVWSIVGTIPTNVYAGGILISSGGIRTVVSDKAGQLTDIAVSPGDTVAKGDTWMYVAQPELLAQIKSAEEQWKRAKDDGDKADGQTRLAELRQQLEASTTFKSPYDGRVVEVKARRGDYVRHGTPLVSVEQTGSDMNSLTAVLYVSSREGEKIHNGMEVKLHPVATQKELYGYMLGTVTSVDSFPSTFESMMNTIGNEQLVKLLLAGESAPVQVKVSLIPDAGTRSGYKWTTPGGPPNALGSGMLADGIVTLETVRPIAKLFPALQ